MTILTVLMMLGIGMIFFKSFMWSPHNIVDYIHTLLVQKKISADLMKTAFVTVIATGLLIMSAVFNLKRQYEF